MKLALAVAGSLAALLPLAAAAATIPAAKTSAADTAVVTYVIQDSVGEIQLCKLALAKSKTPAVRDFAQTMIADHTKILQTALATGKSLNMSATDLEVVPSQEAQISYAHLASYAGHPFDENFLLFNITDHSNDIEALRHTTEIAKSQTSERFAEALLPQYEHHLALANAAADAVARGRDDQS